MKRRKIEQRWFILCLTVTVSLMAVIFYMSSEPLDVSKETSGRVETFVAKLFYTDQPLTEEQLQPVSVLVRKTAHMGSFLLLFLFGYGTVYFFCRFRDKRVSVQKMIGIAYGVALFYGATDEFHQIFTGRGALVIDVVIDGIGALIGVALLVGSWKGFRRRNVSGVQCGLWLAAGLGMGFLLYSFVFLAIHPEVLTLFHPS